MMAMKIRRDPGQSIELHTSDGIIVIKYDSVNLRHQISLVVDAPKAVKIERVSK